MLHELHPTYCLIFVSIVHTCLTIFQTRHNRVTVVFHYFMQVCFMAWKLSEANVSCGFLPLPIWKANPAKTRCLEKKLFLQRFLYQMRQRNNRLFINTCDGLITNWSNLFFFVWNLILLFAMVFRIFPNFTTVHCASGQESHKRTPLPPEKKKQTFPVVKVHTSRNLDYRTKLQTWNLFAEVYS